jgi:NADPH-dependent 2,4-dienoyl-CoA reductase/sulfur reductase-like enzyme
VNRIVVVGASAAGLTAAETLRREGYAGTLTLIGEEPRAPYDRPPLSKQVLSGDWEPERTALRAKERIDELGLDPRFGVAATGLDTAARVVRLADGHEVGYDGLVVATGVRPAGCPARAAVCSGPSTTPWSSVNGSAPASGSWWWEPASSVPRPPVGQVLSNAHREHGVDLRTGVSVTEVADGAVRLADGVQRGGAPHRRVRCPGGDRPRGERSLRGPRDRRGAHRRGLPPPPPRCARSWRSTWSAPRT